LIQKLGHRLRFLWRTFAEALGNFLDEAAFRALICWRVITGRLPQRIEHRVWDPAREGPTLINVYDWTTYSLIFTVLVWPPQDVSAAQADTLEKAYRFQQMRTEEVMATITKGAGGMSWSLLYEREEGLQWDRRREAGVTRDGHAYTYPVETTEARGGG
jgi:hypothetical protein